MQDLTTVCSDCGADIPAGQELCRHGDVETTRRFFKSGETYHSPSLQFSITRILGAVIALILVATITYGVGKFLFSFFVFCC
jgi:hypothetical protein